MRLDLETGREGPIPSRSTADRSTGLAKLKGLKQTMPARKRTTKYRLTTPAPDVAEKQDPEHTEAEFLRDLERVSTDHATERLADPSEHRRGSSKT